MIHDLRGYTGYFIGPEHKDWFNDNHFNLYCSEYNSLDEFNDSSPPCAECLVFPTCIHIINHGKHYIVGVKITCFHIMIFALKSDKCWQRPGRPRNLKWSYNGKEIQSEEVWGPF